MGFTLKAVTAETVAGTIAGWAYTTVNQPMDFLKTMLQLNRTITREFIQGEVQHHGGIFRTFYLGASSIYLFSGVTTAIQFVSFQACYALAEHLNTSTPIKLMISGFMAGLASSFIDTPTEFVKIKTQIDKSEKVGSARRMLSILSREGLSGLKRIYTGHCYKMLMSAPGSSIYYGGFYVSAISIFGEKDRDTASFTSQYLSALLAGFMYSLYAYPIDVLKTNMVSGHTSFAEMMGDKFWKQKSFKQGMGVYVAGGMLAESTCLIVYERCRQSLERNKYLKQ